MKQLLLFVISIVAGSIVMILHELPKSILFNKLSKAGNKKDKRQIYKIYHYIDPIGLIFCITSQVGFSKPYMYRIKSKRTNFLLGITGIVSLLTVFMLSLFLFGRNFYYVYTASASVEFDLLTQVIPANLLFYTALISFNMLIVNLFPVSTFDMGLLIAGKAPQKYFSIIRNDYLIKVLLLMAIIFNLIDSIGQAVIRALL